ncbi:MAG: hypothetical protein ACI91J_001393 [Yoonia sp.]|jgi:hypothetical protein
MKSRLAILYVTSLLAVSPAAVSADTTFFEAKIRPVLVKHCYECHSVEAGKSKGDLLLDTRAALRTGGGSGPAIVPGDPQKSLLLTAIMHTDPDLEMPPQDAKLSVTIIDDFRRWIEMGAPDPREATARAPGEPAPVSIEAGRKFWAFQKPGRGSLPQTERKHWAKRDLDHFILSALEKNQLTPSPDAQPGTLLRRLHFDLTGLPPSPQALAQFLKRRSADGLEKALATEVDTLIASDRYGERWARHWMDVARFAESSGKESNITYPHAWRYRDYAIDAFNDDVPFDRFLTEQIAGDLLPYENDQERARLLVATGFLAFGSKGLNEMNKLQFVVDQVDEQIDTVTRAFMAQSVACARCHDHKYDPFHMQDYYALAGVFGSTMTYYGTWVDSENNNAGELITLPKFDGQLIPNPSMTKVRLATLNKQKADLEREEKERKAAAEAALLKGKNPGDYFSLRDVLRIYWRRGGINGKLATVDEKGRALPLAMGTKDRPMIMDAHLLERGELIKPKGQVKRGFPRVIDVPGVAAPPEKQSGRLQLAQWLTSPDHPLTARVMAHRVWRHLFGEGIVRSMDNFGFSGERPSHPELLDHLALKLMNNGWSVKSLIREIVLSRSYRQDSTWREADFLKDPDNRLLWRANKRRLDAECIRDAMLAVSGKLDTRRRRGSLVAGVRSQSVALFGFNKQIPADLDASNHRSVYLPVVRDRLPDVLDLFDFAEPSLVTGDRETTNVPLQALYLLNSEFVSDQAAALAKRLQIRSDSQPTQIKQAYRLCFGRLPTKDEQSAAAAFLKKFSLPAVCQSLLATAEFRNLD